MTEKQKDIALMAIGLSALIAGILLYQSLKKFERCSREGMETGMAEISK